MPPQAISIGLVSDTHMPERLEQLPDTLYQLFADVQMILHAGDINEAWVLDQLSHIAPVIAVRGNAEVDTITNSLPMQQLVAVAGHRILLTHGYDPEQIVTTSRSDRWEPKLDFFADVASQHGADIFVFGHTHIPMLKEHQGIWLVNPGTLQTGKGKILQTVRTVAVMTLELEKPPQVNHFDIRMPDEPFSPPTDWELGYTAIAQRFIQTIP